MASGNSLSNRLEELRSRNPQSPPSDNVYSGYNTPNRYSGSFMPSHSLSNSSSDPRATLQRRFTADSNNAQTLSPIGQQPISAMDAIDMSASTLYKVQALEKKRLDLEKTREQRRRFDAELERFNRQQAQEEQELKQMAIDLQGMNLASGPQSEPTTPPEYRDHVLSSLYSRRNRYSSSSIISPPGLSTRAGRSGSQLTSPPSEPAQSIYNGSDVDKLPSKSVPGSRRGSTDRFNAYVPEVSVIGQRSTTNNRYSMPVSSTMKQKLESIHDYSSSMGLGHINTTSFLFGDDDEKALGQKESTTSPDVKSYLQMNTTDDKFPILVRNNQQPGVLSASSAALDLALSQSPGPDSRSNGWPSFARHRPSQHSLPQNVFEVQNPNRQSIGSPPSSSHHSHDTVIDSPSSGRQSNRHSLDPMIGSLLGKSIFSQGTSGTSAPSRPGLASMQSFSTNDIPTMKSIHGAPASTATQANTAQQRFHNHNASLGRIPPNAINNRMSREITSPPESRLEEPVTNGFKQLASDLQASAAPFGPATSAGSPVDSLASIVSASMQQYPTPAFYGGYGMQMMSTGMSPMQLGNSTPFSNQVAMYQNQNQFSPYTQYSQGGRFPDSQARIIQQRRMQNAEEVARFTNAKIESYQGEIYSLCKDQHGCRYLQKQLETRNPETVHLIFLETHQHVVELMTDPFGNYLCQKLLEHSNDAQRTVLVNNSAPQMVKIALNQHGTRALQKMIEYISTPEQIQTVIYALKDKVVELIQDLNGNHVIQKCLNRLIPEDAQFIFDAVGAHCVVVGTHRHGCCVLQRCIDHASGQQKADLIAQITQNAYSLVQDPFGNYVLQYIVDLNDPNFTNPLCYSFQASIPDLSKHKFSSNVIEKCLRHADPPIASMMVDEMLNANELEKMLRDSYANYVVQTALDHTDAETRGRLVDAIRPILPSIRQTPYGRRIQTRIISTEGNGLIPSPIETSPVGGSAFGRPMSNGHAHFNGATQRPNGIYGAHNQNMYTMNGINGVGENSAFVANPAATNGHAQKLSNGVSSFNTVNLPTGQNHVQQPIQTYGRGQMHNGYNFF